MFPDTRAFCFHLKPGYCTPPEDGNQRGEPQTLSATCTHPTDDLTLHPRPPEPVETRRNPRAKPVSQKLSEQVKVSDCTPQTKAEQKRCFLLLSSSLPPLNASGDLPWFRSHLCPPPISLALTPLPQFQAPLKEQKDKPGNMLHLEG